MKKFRDYFEKEDNAEALGRFVMLTSKVDKALEWLKKSGIYDESGKKTHVQNINTLSVEELNKLTNKLKELLK